MCSEWIVNRRTVVSNWVGGKMFLRDIAVFHAYVAVTGCKLVQTEY